MLPAAEARGTCCDRLAGEVAVAVTAALLDRGGAARGVPGGSAGDGDQHHREQDEHGDRDEHPGRQHAVERAGPFVELHTVDDAADRPPG